MLNYRVFDTAPDLVAAAAAEVLWVVENSPRAVVALSGGSTPRALYELLGGPFRERLSARRMVWVLGDERDVPPDYADSNGRMIRETLFRDGVPEQHAFLAFQSTLGDPASAFEVEWREEGVSELDLAILGVGEDGHTASLFPGTPILEVTGRVAAEVQVPRLGARRFSLTLPVLRGARRKMVLATGTGKRDIISRVDRGEIYPISEVIDGGGEAWWFVDRDAYPGGQASATGPSR